MTTDTFAIGLLVMSLLVLILGLLIIRRYKP